MRTLTTPSPGRFRVAGFGVRLTGGTALLAGLLVVTLATGWLPAAAPGMSGTAYVAAALLGTAAVGASLLARDLARARTARRQGLAVGELRLSPLGGDAVAGQPRTPAGEARLAAAGPVANAVLGVASGGLAAALWLAGVAPLLVAVTVQVALVNAVLLAVNVLPGLPLDGGRLLRAWLWRRHGDRQRATLRAAGAGRAVGAAVAVGGLVEIVALGRFTGIWTGLLGLMLAAAAHAEQKRVRLESVLSGVTVGTALRGRGDVSVVPGWLTVDGLLREHPGLAGLDPVVPLRAYDSRPGGLLALSAVARVPATEREGVRLRDLAVPAGAVALAGTDELLIEVLPRLVGGYGFVVDDAGVVTGLLTPADLEWAATAAAVTRVPMVKEALR